MTKSKDKIPVTIKEMAAKRLAFDAIVKECEANPTKSRKWVLSLLKRNLEKAYKN